MGLIENYQIRIRTNKGECTGRYRITRLGTRKEIIESVTKYETPAGVFLPEEWKKKALDAIETEGEKDLLEIIKNYCRKHCAWLHTEKEIEEYAIDCLCSRAYRHWEDFGCQ